jgi:hypothetical protein
MAWYRDNFTFFFFMKLGLRHCGETGEGGGIWKQDVARDYLDQGEIT